MNGRSLFGAGEAGLLQDWEHQAPRQGILSGGQVTKGQLPLGGARGREVWGTSWDRSLPRCLPPQAANRDFATALAGEVGYLHCAVDETIL